MKELLDERGVSFPFQRVVALLQSSRRDAVPVGHQGPPAEEAIRFRPMLGLEFPATEVHSVREQDDGRIAVETSFFGLYGTASPLPASYTEDLIEDEREGAITRGFLDLFNHRLISLFYRAMEKYRFSTQFNWEGTDPIARRLQMLCGVTAGMMPPGSELSPVRLLAFASVMRRGILSATNLLAVLRDHLAGIPVDLQQCVSRWMDIPDPQRTRLGTASCRLGEDCMLGTRVIDRSNAFRVVLGPLPLDTFMTFLPGGQRMNALRELLDLVNRGQLDYEVELILDPEEDPELRLGGSMARLAWTSWLGRPAGDARGGTIRFLFQEWFHE